MAVKLARNSYLTRNVGDFPSEIMVGGRKYVKSYDLRYGTNPHQHEAINGPMDGRRSRAARTDSPRRTLKIFPAR